MNMWGFTFSFMEELERRFPAFLEQCRETNPLKGEYFLPEVVSSLIREGKATVQVQRSEDKWYGVTYKEDKPQVTAAIQRMKEAGKYPEFLWQ